MKSVTKIIKELKFILILSVGFVIFYNSILSVYKKLVVTPFLNKANSNTFIDVLFILLLFYFFYSFINKIKKGYFVKDSQAIISLLILSFYCFFRIVENDTFLSFYNFDCIKYFDVVFFYLVIPIALKLYSLLRINVSFKKVEKNNSILDTNIKSSKEDRLSRTKKANRVYKDIKELKLENSSIALGVVGEWGSGKTSFLYMIKEKFEQNKDKDFVIIDFNPWLNISLNSIIQDFFNTLEKSLKRYSVDISKSINKYSNSVLSVYKNNFTESVLKGVNFLFDSSLTEEFKQLNTLLKKLDKRVIIFIDDFDRLQANEIFEILKLIRNTAGFDSFTYVVAYDKEYLIKSLDLYNIPNSDKFSEKIFLKEIELLPINNIQINSILKEGLLTHFPTKDKIINSFFDDIKNRFYPITSAEQITGSLKNLRDVKRFLNSFINDYKVIKEEVYFRDFIVVKLLKFKFYNIYSLLFSNKNDFITIREDRRFRSEYILKPIKEGSTGYSYDEFKETKIEEYIRDVLKYDENKIKPIGVLLNNLFSKSSAYDDNLSISRGNNFYKYFRDELSLDDLSIVEFKKVMSSSFDKIKENIKIWQKNGKLENARVHLYDVKIYELSNRTEYENYIKSMIYIGKLKTTSIRGEEVLFGFEYNLLYKNIENRRNTIVEKYYSNIEELKEFIISIFKEPETPYIFEAEFCYHLLERCLYDNDWFIDRKVFKNYLVSYFTKYTSSIEKPDSNFWSLWHLCKTGDWVRSGQNLTKQNSYSEESKEVFIEFIKRNLDEFLILFIQPQSFFGHTEKDNNLGIGDFVTYIFDSLENFRKFIKSKELKNNLPTKSEFLDEFIVFMDKFIDEGKMIPFEFNYQPMFKRLDSIIKHNNY